VANGGLTILLSRQGRYQQVKAETQCEEKPRAKKTLRMISEARPGWGMNAN